MPRVSFHILWPGGNTTALVEGEFPLAKRKEISAAIIKKHPDVEQVGYLHKPKDPAADIHLEMTGGEFCGNATRCAAFFWARKTGKNNLLVEVSGMDELVDAVVSNEDCSILVPPEMVRGVRDLPEGTMVDLEGISHLIIEGATLPEAEIHRVLEPHKYLPAVGAIFTTFSKNAATIDPYVYFLQGSTPVLIRETACASGSIAAGVVLHRNIKADIFYDITQPTGEKYRVKFMHDSIAIRGPVKYVGTKELYV
ncbi:MAG: hypothetical protein HOO67_01865 [Candidatus Peribacteraceae bacterium]|nr:hypothetical protein [Candidatus Peribacteraceae bacterium]